MNLHDMHLFNKVLRRWKAVEWRECLLSCRSSLRIRRILQLIEHIKEVRDCMITCNRYEIVGAEFDGFSRASTYFSIPRG